MGSQEPTRCGASNRDYGPPVTVKSLRLVPVPAALVTVILPVVALLGTVAVIWVSETTAKLAAAPLKATAVPPAKLLPVSVTTAA